MDIKRMIEFMKNETPEKIDVLQKILDDIKVLLQEEQIYIKNIMHGYVRNEEFSKISGYIEVAEEFSNFINQLEQFEIDNNVRNCEINKELSNENCKDIETQILTYENNKEFSNDIRINYEEYRVDESVEYDILTDFRHMKPAAFSLDGIRYPARQWKLVLLKTCELLYQKNKNIFERFPEDKFMQGKSRIYFAKEREVMLKPEKVAGTNLYVETNLSSNSIRDIIVKMLDQYNIPHAAYKIFLSKNLTPLHPEMDVEVIEDVESEEIDSPEDIVEDSSDMDMSKICTDYDVKTGKCLNEDSPYFVMKCCCKKNCEYRKSVKNDKIIVITKSLLKKRRCIKCGAPLEKTIFPIEVEPNSEETEHVVHGCWCNNCKQAYITEGSYNNFIKDKVIKNIEFECSFSNVLNR